MPSNKEQAHARILARESDPKHQRAFDPDRADRETRNDRLDDPAHNDHGAKLDPEWKQDAKGNWTHPEHPGEK